MADRSCLRESNLIVILGMTTRRTDQPSSAPHPVALPSFAQHLREFAARPDSWGVLARNSIPVVGIYFFGWSVALTVFNYWFDGLSALAVIIAFVIPRAARESLANSMLIKRIVSGVVTWVFLVGLVGLPYWIVLIPLHDLLLSDELRHQLASSPALWWTFGSIVAGHIWKRIRIDYDNMPETQLKQRLRWDVYPLILRAVAMFMIAAHFLTFILVPLMALLLTYLELWPGRVLGAFFGDPSRLYEYDPESTQRRH